MKKYIDVVLKVVLSLILLMPVLGITGILGEPTPDLYHTTEAYDFIMVLTGLGVYINYMMVVVCALGIVLFWTGRVALASILVLPISLNVVAFHLFLDGGLFTAGAFLGNVMLLINLYFIWKHYEEYKPLLEKKA